MRRQQHEKFLRQCVQRDQHARGSRHVVRRINQAWNRGQKEVTIQLTDRIIISPYAAKRLATLLEGVMKEYEGRFGTLQVDATAPAK
ncbi:MAG TPA: DUF3467 domain-containing protein [Burkholderiales bacterium]